MDSPSNAALMEEFGYSICKSCNSEQLTFSINPDGWCIGCVESKERESG